jgi:hypothetical protein
VTPRESTRTSSSRPMTPAGSGAPASAHSWCDPLPDIAPRHRHSGVARRCATQTNARVDSTALASGAVTIQVSMASTAVQMGIKPQIGCPTTPDTACFGPKPSCTATTTDRPFLSPPRCVRRRCQFPPAGATRDRCDSQLAAVPPSILPTSPRSIVSCHGQPPDPRPSGNLIVHVRNQFAAANWLRFLALSSFPAGRP